VAYLAFILQWTLQSGLSPLGTAGGLLLWAFEVVASVMAAAYLWELCDAMGTEHWRRRVTFRLTGQLATQSLRQDDGELPFVSLHVPAHNEPPEMVIETLTSLLRIDYPRYEVIAIDDNTSDESLWRPGRGVVRVQRREVRPPLRLARLQVRRAQLRAGRADRPPPPRSSASSTPTTRSIRASCAAACRCSPTRAWASSRPRRTTATGRAAPYLRRLYFSYKYFFAISQPSRNEHDGAIFAGTMGLIRRRALEQVGGWDEWCITEDAELSLRLLRAGWSGLHVDASMGQGVMPLTFEALKSQRYRWCFGGIQIMRAHLGSLLPFAGGSANKLSIAQRWAYLSGALQWYGDLLGLIFYVFLLVGAFNLYLGGDQLFRKLSVFLVATIPVLVVLGLVRAVALVRRGTGATWSDAIGAFFIWQSTSLVVARASVQGCSPAGPSSCAPRRPASTPPVWQVMRANWAETALAAAGRARHRRRTVPSGHIRRPLLAALLVVPTLGWRPLRSTAWPPSAPCCRRSWPPAVAPNGAATAAPSSPGPRPASPRWRRWRSSRSSRPSSPHPVRS
jgi:hypothetical protein